MLTKASENEIALEANYFKPRTWVKISAIQKGIN